MKFYLFTSLVVALLLVLIPASSQLPKGFSINPKGGIFISPNHENGGVLGVETNYLQNGWMFSGDFFQLQEINYKSSTENIYRQAGLMGGKYYGDRLFRFQLQGGIAALWELGPADLSDHDVTAVGFVLKTGFKFIPLHFLSIGLDLQSNLNPKRSFLMPLISIEVGKLRDKIN